MEKDVSSFHIILIINLFSSLSTAHSHGVFLLFNHMEMNTLSLLGDLQSVQQILELVGGLYLR